MSILLLGNIANRGSEKKSLASVFLLQYLLNRFHFWYLYINDNIPRTISSLNFEKKTLSPFMATCHVLITL